MNALQLALGALRLALVALELAEIVSKRAGLTRRPLELIMTALELTRAQQVWIGLTWPRASLDLAGASLGSACERTSEGPVEGSPWRACGKQLESAWRTLQKSSHGKAWEGFGNAVESEGSLGASDWKAPGCACKKTAEESMGSLSEAPVEHLKAPAGKPVGRATTREHSGSAWKRLPKSPHAVR